MAKYLYHYAAQGCKPERTYCQECIPLARIHDRYTPIVGVKCSDCGVWVPSEKQLSDLFELEVAAGVAMSIYKGKGRTNG